MKEINIIELYSGKEELIKTKNKEFKSSYRKKKVENSVTVTKLGFEHDFQTDKKNHGGENQAICIYPQSAYDFFKEKYNLDLPTCAFGENITIKEGSDRDFCIGDKYSCGEVIFEVSQPRGPCWKISKVLGIKELTSLVIKELKSGFYFRVLKEGKIDKNSKLELLERKYEKLTIEYVYKCYSKPKENQNNLKEIILCPELSDRFRANCEKKIN